MKLLITGASGFVGRGVVDALRHHADLTLVASPLGTIDPHHADLRWIRRDLSRPSDLEFLSGQDAVLHLAGLAHVTR